jgi:hypothetical protein
MKKLLLVLFSRLVLFVFFQALIAAALGSWFESEKYWILIATLTNIVSISLLIFLVKREGLTYLSMFHFNRVQWKRDMAFFLGLAVLSIPVVLVPSFALSTWLWGNTDYYHQVLFQPIPAYIVYVLIFTFPVTIGMAELATYFGYVMPRLKRIMQPQWKALALPVVFLALQHCTLPLVFETKFIFLRAFMYLPFSLILGVALYKRPSLLPWLAILHGVLDAMAIFMLLAEVRKG